MRHHRELERRISEGLTKCVAIHMLQRMRLLRRVIGWFNGRPPATSEEQAARAEAIRMREEIETERTGSLEGAPMFTHGGKESREGF